MACLVHAKDKRTGIIYVYSSESYWDKEKKAPRNRRTLIGKLDPETGEIVQTDGRRRNKMNQSTEKPTIEKTNPSSRKSLVAKINKSLIRLSEHLAKANAEYDEIRNTLNQLIEM